MFELMTRLNKVKAAFLWVASLLFCHRMIYLALSLCHGSGCLITEKPELYGPMAALYAILALRG